MVNQHNNNYYCYNITITIHKLSTYLIISFGKKGEGQYDTQLSQSHLIYSFYTIINLQNRESDTKYLPE